MTATPTTTTSPLRRGSLRIPELTSIRALAAFAVCATHAAYWTGFYTDDWLGRVAARLEIGVTVFFVLSGFLLFRPWVQALTDLNAKGGGSDGVAVPGTGRAPSLKRYAWHRVRRILPAYWITVIVIYLLDVFPPPGPTPDAPPVAEGWEGFFRTMFFLQSAEVGWFHSGLTHIWSLVVEVGFYLVLPFVGMLIWWLVKGLWKPGIVIAVVIGFALIAPLWSILAHQWDAVPFIARLWPMGFFDWFAAGMLMAVLSRMGWKAPLLAAWPLALGFLLMSTTDLAGPATLVPGQLSEALWKNALYLGTAAALLAPLMLRSRATTADATDYPPVRGAGWLRHRALYWLGEISYEFFLVHVIVLEYVMPWLGYGTFTGSFLGVLALTTAISLPLAWLLRRLTDVITRTPAPETPWRQRI